MRNALKGITEEEQDLMGHCSYSQSAVLVHPKAAATVHDRACDSFRLVRPRLAVDDSTCKTRQGPQEQQRQADRLRAPTTCDVHASWARALSFGPPPHRHWRQAVSGVDEVNEFAQAGRYGNPSATATRETTCDVYDVHASWARAPSLGPPQRRQAVSGVDDVNEFAQAGRYGNPSATATR